MVCRESDGDMEWGVEYRSDDVYVFGVYDFKCLGIVEDLKCVVNLCLEI